jgi:phage terminase Nu1 subunit (DNA packaging protein)
VAGGRQTIEVRAVTLLVNKAELARTFGVSEPTVSKWLVDGCPFEKGGSNGVAYEFDVDRVKAWKDGRDRLLADQAREREAAIRAKQNELFGEKDFLPEGLSQDEVKTYLENVRLSDYIRRQRGELVDRANVANEFQAVFNVVRQHALGWATTLAKTAGLTGEQQRAAESLARRTLDAMWRQISDPAMRPALDDAVAGD